MAKSLVPPGLGGYHSPVIGYKYDAVKAAELLRLAGFPNGRGLPTLKLKAPGAPGGRGWPQVVDGLKAIGIHAEVEYIPTAIYFEALSRGEFEVFRDGWIADYPDPLDLFQLFYSRSASNHSRYSSPQYDTLFEQAEWETDPQKRFELFQRMEEILLEDCPAVFYMHEVETFGLHPKVHNLELSVNPFRMRFYKYVWIE